LAFQAGLVVGTLRAVAAILAASPGLHAQEGAELDFVLFPKFQMNPAAFLNEIEKRTAIDLFEFF
jgi:hypothetical protein